MGHATHFLQRLERLDGHHVEWALHIYRDPDLVRLVLSVAKIPDNADRIALSLDHPEKGPFVIVERTGDFVTCLGEGMAPTGCAVVPRRVLDSQVQRLDTLRARKAIFEKQLERRGSTAKLFKRVWDSGHRLSREDYIAATTVVPLVRMDLWAYVMGLPADYSYVLNKLIAGPVEKRFAKPTDQDLDQMLLLWTMAWQMGHCYTLAAVDGEAPAGLIRYVEDKGVEFDPAWAGVRTGLPAVMVRCGWAMAQHEKLFLRGAKHRLTSVMTSSLQYCSASVTLLSIGINQPKLQGEIRKAFQKCTMEGAPATAREKRNSLRAIPAMLKMMQGEPDYIRRLFVDHRKALHQTWPGLSNLYETADDVPEEVVKLCLANDCLNIFDYNGEGMLPVTFALQQCVRDPGEYLYAPEKEIPKYLPPWDERFTIDYLLKPHLKWYGHHTPIQNDQPKVGRNDPCSCNSGKKYKVCCGK